MKLRAIMAVSADGLFARGPDDNMRWTGKADKQVFRALTTVGGVMGAGTTTYDSMKGLQLPGRSLVRLRSTPDKCEAHNEMTLGKFAAAFPGAWLIGGPTVLKEAVETGMVDEVFLSVVGKVISRDHHEHAKAISAYPVYDLLAKWDFAARQFISGIDGGPDVELRTYRRG